MGLDLQTIKRMLLAIVGVQPQELTCDECMEFLDHYAELELAGKKPEKALPLVYAHLAICHDCREEYHGLLLAMRAFAY
jgi:uncharacterized protein with PIN domain